MQRKFDFAEGEILLIDKPLKWTSFDVVNKIRWLIKNNLKLLTRDGGKIKVGHAGTLDPLATGLLIICTGKFTKRIEEFQQQEKEYTGTFCIGATTASADLEKEIDQYFPTEHISDEMIRDATKKFIGVIDQSPPLFSAINVNGKRAYKLARKGDETILPTRKVEIRKFEISEIKRPGKFIDVNFRVVCSKGTYIRALARDFGVALNSGAHLTALRRTAIGEYKVSDAMTVVDFETILANSDQ
ncbi:MAG: tRNA pseudouridine(55) synthase TruB [Bacteroidetes bacterium]|nr:tRNA pseudouridine(55) synthase TruB [Bacteroidota bacterium]